MLSSTIGDSESELASTDHATVTAATRKVIYDTVAETAPEDPDAFVAWLLCGADRLPDYFESGI